MAIILDGWQAIVASIIVVMIFCWAGYSTCKVFAFSERDIKQRKYIYALENRINGLELLMKRRNRENEISNNKK